MEKILNQLRKEKRLIYVISKDQSILGCLNGLDVDFDLATPSEMPNLDRSFDLYFDLDSYTAEEYCTLKTRYGDLILNSLILSTGSPELDVRITLASIGISSIADKSNLLLELSAFLRRTEGGNKDKILLIDDSPTDLFSIKKTLTESGYDVHAYLDSMEAIQSIDKIDPALILVDIHMPPPLDGPTFVRVIRQIPKYTSLPIVFISGEGNVGVKISSLEAGADDFISKPIDVNLSERIINKNIKRSEQQKDQINRDPLTKAFNRNYLTTVTERLAGSKGTFVCAIVDIDHFKNINDTYGHIFGDHALKHLSGLLQRQLRQKDLVFRFGGEEFILIIDIDNLMSGAVIIDRLRRTLEKTKISLGEHSCTMTFSAGVHLCEDGNIDNSLEISDKRLYQAKESGRNKVVFK